MQQLDKLCKRFRGSSHAYCKMAHNCVFIDVLFVAKALCHVLDVQEHASHAAALFPCRSNAPGFRETKLGRQLQKADYAFLGFFTFEALLKIVAMGLVLKPYTYLRNGGLPQLQHDIELGRASLC